MEYSIRELARLSGVTTRTLRWYDQIGLLKPSRVAENGYRFYGTEEVDRLQDILYYRAMGVELAQIRQCLDHPAFDRLTALRGHLAKLEAEQARIEGLIASVKETIATIERKESMSDAQKFQAFKRRVVEANERDYGKELRETYGDAEVDAAHESILGLTREQYDTWQQLGRQIRQKLEQAVTEGLRPESDAGREVTQLHRRWLTITGNQYDESRHKGLAELYVADARFTAYYDAQVPGCARFLRDAVFYWAGK